MTLSDEMLEELFHSRRMLVLDRDIDVDVANRLSAQMLIAGDSPAPVMFRIEDTTGGRLSDALAIYDTMRTAQYPLVTFGAGTVAGASVILLAAGLAGWRSILSDAVVRLTPVGSGAPDGDDPDDPAAMMTLVDRRGEVAEILAGLTGQAPGRVYEDMLARRAFSGPEAVDHGFADHVVGA